MLIHHDSKRIKQFSEMLLAHPFEEYRGLTSTYRGFEAPNLDEELKLSFLQKLSVANPLAMPSFAQFWMWVRKNHGMKLAGQMCDFLYPKDDPDYQKNLNRMRAKQTHAFWKHIKARVYKKWCSIVTEGQCVYALLRGIKKAELPWKVLASAQLDAVGIDLVLVTDSQVVPIQIKKDTFSRYAAAKKNSQENFSRFELSRKAMKVLKDELQTAKITSEIVPGMVLKYALAEAGKMVYSYLGQFENGFVYFKSHCLLQAITQRLHASPLEKA